GIVAAVLREHAFEFRRLHVVLVGGVRIGINAVALLHCLPQLRVAAHHHIEHPLVLVGELVLVQLAEPHPRLQHHIAGARLELAAENLHQGRFAGAVRPDQPIAVAVAELDGDLLKQRFRAKLNGDVGSGKHLYPIVGRVPRHRRSVRTAECGLPMYRGTWRRFKAAPAPAADSSRAGTRMLDYSVSRYPSPRSIARGGKGSEPKVQPCSCTGYAPPHRPYTRRD